MMFEICFKKLQEKKMGEIDKIGESWYLIVEPRFMRSFSLLLYMSENVHNTNLTYKKL